MLHLSMNPMSCNGLNINAYILVTRYCNVYGNILANHYKCMLQMDTTRMAPRPLKVRKGMFHIAHPNSLISIIIYKFNILIFIISNYF